MWFIIAIALGIGLTLLFMFVRSRSLKIAWYEWVLAAAGLLLLLFTIQNFNTAFSEWESKAAWLYLPTLGLPALILLAVSSLLVIKRNRAA